MNNSSPIIVIGAARSGTKFLRDLLASVDGVKAVPYDVNYVWRSGHPSNSSDNLNANDLTETRIEEIRSTLEKLAGTQSGDVLVEKTVSNTLRVEYVNKVFPDARYVHIVRDGRDATYSAMQQWRSSPDWLMWLRKLRSLPLRNYRYALWLVKSTFSKKTTQAGHIGVWGPRFPGIETMVRESELVEVCATQWLTSVRSATNDLKSIANARERVFTIKYEELVANENVIDNLAHGLKLPHRKVLLQNYKSMVRPGNVGNWTKMSVRDKNLLDQFAHIHKEYFQTKNPYYGG
jgi:hypothetical protein